MPFAVLAGAAFVATGAAVVQPIVYADKGRTIQMQRGAERTLRLGVQRVWNRPRVSSGAVQLTPVLYYRYPGFQEWTIAARAPGKATLTVVGRKPNEATRRFRLTIVVR